MFTTLLLVGLSTLSPPSSAADEETTAPASAPLTLESDLHEHYIQGQDILIWLGVRNLSEETQPFPALDGEPWRVQFELTPEGGSKEVRSNVKAEDSEPKTWSISPGRARSTLLELPSGRSLSPGRYTLQLKVQTESGLLELPEHRLELQSAAPVYTDLLTEPMGPLRDRQDLLWVHRSGDAYSLRLQPMGIDDSREALGGTLLHVQSEPYEPLLSRTRPQEAMGRHVYWKSGEQSVSYLRLDGDSSDQELRRVGLPYPAFHPIGRALTDANGDLHVPIWIPAPSGPKGELRLLSVRERQQTRLLSVAQLDQQPAWVESAVDAAGLLRLLVSGPQEDLVLYTLSPETELPARGKRITRHSSQLGRFAYLDGSDSWAGGLALLVVDAVTLEDGRAGVQSRWLDFEGRVLMTEPAQALDRSQLVGVQARGRRGSALLLGGQGSWELRCDELDTQAVPSDGPPSLLTRPDGAVGLRGERGGLIQTRWFLPESG